MDDQISRQAAIDAVTTHGTEMERRGITVLSVSNHKQVTVDLLESLPSAQPDLCDGCDRYGASCVGEGCGKLEMPEIIRCKDCKHYIRSNATNLTVCNKYNGLPYTVEGTDFCSRAERRTDGSEQP